MQDLEKNHVVHVFYGCLFGTYATIGGISYVIPSSWRYNNDNNQQLNTSHSTYPMIFQSMNLNNVLQSSECLVARCFPTKNSANYSERLKGVELPQSSRIYNH